MSFVRYSDVLHPNRANVSKDELRDKLASLYKASKDQVSCFGFRTQYGGGKSTGFALIYDSGEALKKFEPRYRLVRYGVASKIEKASRQQRMYTLLRLLCWGRRYESLEGCRSIQADVCNRQATKEPSQDCERHGKGEGGFERQEEIESLPVCLVWVGDSASENISLYLSRISQGAHGHDIAFKILLASVLLIVQCC